MIGSSQVCAMNPEPTEKPEISNCLSLENLHDSLSLGTISNRDLISNISYDRRNGPLIIGFDPNEDGKDDLTYVFNINSFEKGERAGFFFGRNYSDVRYSNVDDLPDEVRLSNGIKYIFRSDGCYHPVINPHSHQ